MSNIPKNAAGITVLPNNFNLKYFYRFTRLYNITIKIENAPKQMYFYSYQGGAMSVSRFQQNDTHSLRNFTIALQNLHHILVRLETNYFTSGFTVNDMKLMNFVYRQLRLRNQIEKVKWRHG